MPDYTNPWTNTSPPGSQAANTIDDEIRKLRLDIFQRMSDVVEDWTADPVIPLGGGGASSLGLSRVANYNEDIAPGSRVSGYNNLAALLAFTFLGYTNSVGVISININEFNLASGDTHNWQAALLTPYSFHGIRTDINEPIHLAAYNWNIPSNIINFTLRHYSGVLVQSRQVLFNTILASTLPPVT